MKKSKIPHTYTLIFYIIIFMAILTWIVPSGQFATEMIAGKTVPKAGTYHSIAKVTTDKAGTVTDIRQGIKDILMAPIKGGESAAAVLVFVLIIGGPFGIISKSGAIEAGLAKTVRTLEGKELLIIPVAMILFGLGAQLLGCVRKPFHSI